MRVILKFNKSSFLEFIKLSEPTEYDRKIIIVVLAQLHVKISTKLKYLAKKYSVVMDDFNHLDTVC